MAKRRLNKDEMFMEQARVYARRSACLQFQVGVVFIKDDVVVSGGYNGPPRGEPNCDEVGCAKLDKNGNRLPAGSGQCRGAHAEMNAIVNAAAREGGLKKTRVYSTISPCYDCAKHLAGLPIVEFVFEKEYKEKEGKKAIELLRRRGVKVRQFKLKKEEKI